MSLCIVPVSLLGKGTNPKIGVGINLNARSGLIAAHFQSLWFWSLWSRPLLIGKSQFFKGSSPLIWTCKVALVLLTEEQPLSMMLPPPCLTVGADFLALKASS